MSRKGEVLRLSQKDEEKKLFTFSKLCILMFPGRTFIGPMANQQHITCQLRRLYGQYNFEEFEEAVLYVSICAISSVSSLQNIFSIRSMQTIANETFDEPVEGWIA